MDIVDAALPFDPRALWPDYRPTRLVELPRLARRAGVARVFAKLENERPLGNFKSLGGACAGLRALARHAGADTLERLRTHRHALPPLLCASEGNHGLAVAAAARHAGTRARVYLSSGVSDSRAARIIAMGSDIIRIDGTFDDAVRAATQACQAGGGLLIPDTSDDPDDQVVADVMAGYGVIPRELSGQFRDMRVLPTHAFMQAGVGGLAAGMARGLAEDCRWSGRMLTVEPVAAACVAHALAKGAADTIGSDLRTHATMLACGRASAAALRILMRHGARGLSVTDVELDTAPGLLRAAGGTGTTSSGAAGVAGLLHVADQPGLRLLHALDADSCVLVLVSEGAVPEDA